MNEKEQFPLQLSHFKSTSEADLSLLSDPNIDSDHPTGPPSSQSHPPPPPPSSAPSSTATSVNSDTCYLCYGRGHWARCCTSLPPIYLVENPPRCFTCGGIGHYARFCPSRAISSRFATAYVTSPLYEEWIRPRTLIGDAMEMWIGSGISGNSNASNGDSSYYYYPSPIPWIPTEEALLNDSNSQESNYNQHRHQIEATLPPRPTSTPSPHHHNHHHHYKLQD